MKQIRKMAMWVVWNISIGRLAPYVMRFALNTDFITTARQAEAMMNNRDESENTYDMYIGSPPLSRMPKDRHGPDCLCEDCEENRKAQ